MDYEALRQLLTLHVFAIIRSSVWAYNFNYLLTLTTSNEKYFSNSPQNINSV